MLTRAGLCAAFTGVAFALPAIAAEPPKAMPPTGALKALTVFPAEVVLNGPRDSQRILVLGEYADGRKWDLTRQAKLASSAAAMVAVDNAGILRPASDGQATVTVQAAGQTATVAVQVKNAKTDSAVSFT